MISMSLSAWALYSLSFAFSASPIFSSARSSSIFALRASISSSQNIVTLFSSNSSSSMPISATVFSAAVISSRRASKPALISSYSAFCSSVRLSGFTASISAILSSIAALSSLETFSGLKLFSISLISSSFSSVSAIFSLSFSIPSRISSSFFYSSSVRLKP